MKKHNMFWPVYKNLEKEILMLADRIHFTDNQVKVYSIYIADLLVRTVIEIEAISKELYSEIGGETCLVDSDGKKRDMYFDTDCLALLNEKWKLSNKQVLVSATNFYFSADENKVLKPLYKADKRGTSGSKWKQAYQAVKHDRKNSLEEANIKNLLHALAALYILNVYYKNETIEIGNVYTSTNFFDNRVGSEIFSIFCYEAIIFKMGLHMDDRCIVQIQDNSLVDSVYIIKCDNYTLEKMHEDYCMRNQSMLNHYKDLQTQDDSPCTLDDMGTSLWTIPNNINVKYEAVLNKNISIYPTLQPIDHCDTI